MTAAVAEPDTVEVTAPGVYDLPDHVYHSDPVPGGSLSSSGARLLLPPSCPARFRYAADNPTPPTATLDFGHAAHREVLGAGPEIVVVDAEDWRTKAAREQRDAAHAAGAVPLLPGDYQQVQAMAAAIRQHPAASALLRPGRGRPEQSLFWKDNRTAVRCRARLDWLPDPTPGRMILADYKTCQSAAPDALPPVIHKYGYHQQAAWYIDGVLALGLASDVAWVWVFQEKTPPYLVSVVQPTAVAMRIGRDLNREALRIYRRCTEAGEWPGYSSEVEVVSLPSWVENRYLEAIAS